MRFFFDREKASKRGKLADIEMKQYVSRAASRTVLRVSDPLPVKGSVNNNILVEFLKSSSLDSTDAHSVHHFVASLVNLIKSHPKMQSIWVFNRITVSFNGLLENDSYDYSRLDQCIDKIYSGLEDISKRINLSPMLNMPSLDMLPQSYSVANDYLHVYDSQLIGLDKMLMSIESHEHLACALR